MQKATTDFPSLAKYIFFTKVVIYLSEAKSASEENSLHLDNEVKQDKTWQIKAAMVARGCKWSLLSLDVQAQTKPWELLG